MRTESNLLNVISAGSQYYRWVGGINPAPNDFAVASTTVTFSGVIAGTEIRVYRFDGVELAGIEECVANQVLTWETYALGSFYNVVQITLLLRGYRWQKFPLTSTIGARSIPIFQTADLGWTP